MRYKSTPMIIQRKAIDYGRREKTWGLLSDMGTGKTLSAIYWAAEEGCRIVAVLGRPDDLDTWSEELATHTNASFANICRKKTKAARKAHLKEALERGVTFILMTYDSVKQMKGALRNVRWDCVIADEMTELRHGSKKTKAVISVFGDVPRRLGMTGTMITNTPLNVFYQMQFIDGGERLGTNEWKFKNKFFWPDPNSHGFYPFDDTIPKLRKLIYQKCIRFRKEDALDLPPKVFLKKPCSLTPPQEKAYRRVRDEFELELMSGEILELDYKVQQFTKLLQITGGFYYTPDGKGNAENLPCGKLENLRWMLDQDEFRRTKKIVIWAAFNHELEMIRDLAVELGYHGVMFWKHTEDRRATRLQFRDDPACQLFIGQAASGIGMNELVVSDTVFYYSRSLKLIHRLQSIDRTHRKGSERHRSIRYIDLIVPGTVDARVYTMLKKCKDVADMIIDGRKTLELIRLGS